MTPKRWLALLAFYTSYLFFGASIYFHIENNLEKGRRAVALEERIEINEYLVYQFKDKDNNTQDEILDKLTKYCEKPVTNYTLDKYDEPYKWTFYHSFFFAFTVCSTVGYGNLAPTTALGQMVMIPYSLIGVPVSGILFTGLGEFFTIFFTNIYKRYKEYKAANNDLYVPRKFGLIATTLMALVPGITIFIILPSFLFSYFENWPFTEALYYSYVTTTTIGFGDIVPTFQKHQEREFGFYFILYEIFIIFWFIFSLGYLVMIFSFITKGLRSQRLARLEKNLSLNIKATQARIWHGVTKDVGYLRKILNELYMNVKPVYHEPGDKFDAYLRRSVSCPDLQMYRVTTPIISRKRAFSESFDKLIDDSRQQLATGTPLQRRLSDTNLDRINKQKTFETVNAFKETTNLLARVVTALAHIEMPIAKQQGDNNNDDFNNESINSAMFGAFHGFSDSQILASEWSYPYAENPTKIPYRARACSDFFLSPKTMTPNHNEWTWSGDNDHIQEFINNRQRFSNKQNSFKPFTNPNTELQNPTILNIDPEDTGKSKSRKFSTESKAFFNRLIPFKKRGSRDILNIKRKQSTISVPEEPKTYPHPENYYSTITVGHAQPNGKTDRKGSIFPPVNNFFNNLFSNKVDRKEKPTPDRETEQRKPQIHNDAKLILGNGMMYNTERRGSMFSGNSDRQGSTINKGSDYLDNNFQRSFERSGSILQNKVSARRGSLFQNSEKHSNSITSGRRARNSNSFGSGSEHHGSLFSVPSQEEIDKNILENTTIADIIRALEVLHTRSTLETISDEKEPPKMKKQRKLGTATPPEFPPIFTMFSQSRNDEPRDTGINSGRRSTIFGSVQNHINSTALGLRNSKRRTSLRPKLDPPPSYTTEEITAKEATNKFRRRFSVRPTELQIPLGKAPAPISTNQPMQSFTSQTALQRRLSLRPSPLAREMKQQQGSSGSLAGRGSLGSISSSSTHSPLSRMAQIQAIRKNSNTAETLGIVTTDDKSNKEQPPE